MIDERRGTNDERNRPRSSFVRGRRSATLLALLILAVGCSPAAAPAGRSRAASESTKAAVQAEGGSQGASEENAPQLKGPTPAPRPTPTGLKAEVVAEGLQLPANLTFAPDGRIFLTEVSAGQVRVIDHGTLLRDAFAEVDEAVRKEDGLLGLALDPDFAHTHYVYIYYSESLPEKPKPWRNRVVRFTDVGGRGADMQVILDNLPISNWLHNGGHNGGRLGFGRDGKLYVTVGDVGDEMSSQDPSKLTGKLLRLNPDGSVPADSPSPGSPVYALGLRNAWGLDFHPVTGVPYVTDNSGIGHDEVNRIQAGGNYGAPHIQGIQGDPRYIDPLWESGPERGGIAGLAFYTGDLFPEYKNDLLFCRYGSGRLFRLKLAEPDYERVEQQEVISDQCNLDVATGPDGAIYFTSVSKLLRLVPAR